MSFRLILAAALILCVLPHFAMAETRLVINDEMNLIDTAYDACTKATTFKQAGTCADTFRTIALDQANRLWAQLQKSPDKIRLADMSAEQRMHYTRSQFQLKCTASANPPYYSGTTYEYALNQPHWCLQYVRGLLDLYKIEYDQTVTALIDTRMAQLRKIDNSKLR